MGEYCEVEIFYLKGLLLNLNGRNLRLILILGLFRLKCWVIFLEYLVEKKGNRAPEFVHLRRCIEAINIIDRHCSKVVFLLSLIIGYCLLIRKIG